MIILYLTVFNMIVIQNESSANIYLQTVSLFANYVFVQVSCIKNKFEYHE